MHPEGEADELRQDGRAARPHLDHGVRAGASRFLGLLEQIAVDERTFPNRACHLLTLLLMAVTQDVFVGRPVVARLLAFGRFAPRRHRVTAAGGAAFAAAMR